VSAPAQRTGAALAITLGIVLDGVPESAVLGLTLLEGSVSIAMLAAVFLSNIPEAIAATSGLRERLVQCPDPLPMGGCGRGKWACRSGWL
jgi:hypothetical protein